MATLVLGREIVAEALRTGDVKPYIEAGLTLPFMEDWQSPAYAAVFSGQDIDAWLTILRYHEVHRKVPDVKVFRMSFPDGTYDLPVSRTTAPELAALARAAINQFEAESGHTEASRYIDAGDPVTAAQIFLATARKVLSQQAGSAVTRAWDDPGYDVRKRLEVVVSRGPGFGVPELDEQFPGFQAAQLITLLGRAKANKTTFLLVSAFQAWLGKTAMKGSLRADIEPRRVMFVTTEITEDGIRDRLTAYGAGVDPGPLLASTEDYRYTPDSPEGRAMAAFWEREVSPYEGDAFRVIQPLGKYGVDQIEAAAESFEPGVVYIDGFYFLYDPETKRMGGHWEAHDNLAREIKSLAMRLNVPVVVTHQVREKQLGSAGGGIDDGAMMGGTGLRMASDLVMGLDKDKKTGTITFNTTASRNAYLKTVTGKWDWKSYRFTDVQVVAEQEEWEGEGDEQAE